MEMTVVKYDNNTWMITTYKNYHSYVSNARAKHYVSGYTLEDVLDLCYKHYHATPDKIEVIQ